MKRNVAFMGLFLALALVLSYVEAIIPISIGIPGVKLGLANIVIVIALYGMGTKEAYILSVLRILLAGFLFGNVFAIFYSLAGGMLSLTCMALLKRMTSLSMVTVSIVGGVTHNLGQIVIASMIVENYHVMYYFPVLLVAGCVTGVLIGIVSALIYKRLRRVLVKPQSREPYIRREKNQPSDTASTKLAIKDIVFLAAVFGVGFLMLFVIKPLVSEDGNRFQILVDGEVYGEYSLEEDISIDVVVNDRIINTVEVSDGEVYMSDASCPDKLCVKEGHISHKNESIICLPNKVVIEVTQSDEESEYDTIAR